MGVLQGHEQGVVIEPRPLALAEGGELVRVLASQATRRAGEHVKAAAPERAVVHARRVGPPGSPGVLLATKQSLLGQVVEVYQVGVAGVGGEGLVGGVPVARGDDGEDLPDGDSRPHEEVHERTRLRPQGPHPPGGGERRYGHEDAATSHAWILSRLGLRSLASFSGARPSGRSLAPPAQRGPPRAPRGRRRAGPPGGGARSARRAGRCPGGWW